MSNELLYIHVWSNGDITIHCYTCKDAPRHLNYNHSVGNKRTFSYASYVNGPDLTNQFKFVGCKVCGRGAEIQVLRKTAYRLEFSDTKVQIHILPNYLGGPLTGPWILSNTQDRYDRKN